MKNAALSTSVLANQVPLSGVPGVVGVNGLGRGTPGVDGAEVEDAVDDLLLLPVVRRDILRLIRRLLRCHEPIRLSSLQTA